MDGDPPHFDDLINDAHRATVALDGVTAKDSSKARVAAVSECRRVYEQMLDYRGSVRMTVAESVALQNALDQLRARLKFFGEPV
jgi:hypothetical protein